MKREQLAIVLVTVLVGIGLAPRSALAADGEAKQAPPDAVHPMSAFWPGLGVYTGTLLVGGIGVVAAAAAEDGRGWARAAGYAGAGIMLAAPGLAGATVCAVARRSPYHDRGCGAPIGAAYAGLLAATGLFVLANQVPSSGLTWAAVLGVLVLPPAAAVAGWELGKHPVSAPGRRDEGLQAPTRAHDRAGRLSPGMLAAPLLAGRF